MISLPNPHSTTTTERNNEMFNSTLQSLPQFIMEMNADWGMVYDFMEAQCGELRDEHWEEVSQVYQQFSQLEDS